jgi:hypothetical protein
MAPLTRNHLHSRRVLQQGILQYLVSTLLSVITMEHLCAKRHSHIELAALRRKNLLQGIGRSKILRITKEGQAIY